MMEHWKNAFGVLQCWVNGNNSLDDKIKNGQYPLKKPLFHYSMIEAETQTSDNTQYFH